MNPREKKERDLSGHCKNRYGNSDKAARKGVRRKKRVTTHRARREGHHTITQISSAHDPDEVELPTLPSPLGGYSKWPDTPIREVLHLRLSTLTVKWKPITLIWVVGGPLLAAGLFAPSLAWRWREHRLTQQIEPVQTALQSYRLQHGSYPDSLAAASIPEPEEIYYQREPDGSYILWFGMELGESVTFRSVDRNQQ